MVPFVTAIVPEVDVAAGRVTVTPPPGLFEELPPSDETTTKPDAEPLTGCRRDRDGRRPARPRTPRGPDMRIDVVSIFPEYFGPLEMSLLGKARGAGILDIRTHDLREWTHDRHRTVDDTPYGGGAGMVMKPEPWGEALDALRRRRSDGLGRPAQRPRAGLSDPRTRAGRSSSRRPRASCSRRPPPASWRPSST